MMKGLYTTILVAACLLMGRGNAYSQEMKVLGSAGTFTGGSVYSVAWTIGEAIVVTATSGTFDITQGFHQDDLWVVGVEEYLPNVEISVYPNPARDLVNISSSENALMSLIDIQGKLVETFNINSTTNTIDVSHLSRGTYTLIFEANGTIAKRMKIIIL